MKKTLTIMDFETNGFKPELHSVLSVYAIKVLVDLEQKTMEKIDEYEGYYYRNLGEQENIGATRVNGLYDNIIEKKRTELSIKRPLHFVEDEENFKNFYMNSDVFISHNIGFDSKFLKQHHPKMWCSMKQVSNEIRNQLGGKDPKLKELASCLNVPWEENNLHGAKYDTLILGRCLYRLLQKNDENFIKCLKEA